MIAYFIDQADEDVHVITNELATIKREQRAGSAAALRACQLEGYKLGRLSHKWLLEEMLRV